jgi:hypothetical protein
MKKLKKLSGWKVQKEGSDDERKIEKTDQRKKLI